MSKIPYMPFYVDDFEADTAHLTLEEDGLYNRLLRLCWRSPGCALPADPNWICRRLRVDRSRYESLVKPIIDEYFDTRNRQVFQKRQMAEFDRSRAKSLAAQRNGQKGGRPRKTLKTQESEQADACESVTPEKTIQNHNQNQSKKDTSDDVSKKADGSPAGQQPDKKLTPRKALEQALSPPVAQAVLEHRQRLGKPLTAYAARLLVKAFRRTDDPEAAANTMIANGWQGFEPEWLERRATPRPGNRHSTIPPPHGNETDLQRISRELRQRNDPDRSHTTIDHEPLSGLPGKRQGDQTDAGTVHSGT